MPSRKKSAKPLKALVIFIAMSSASSCGHESMPAKDLPTQQEVNRGMEYVNQQFARDERAMIEGYIQRMGWKMKSSGTGLYYSIDSTYGAGSAAKDGQRVRLAYEVSLLNGSAVYSSKEKGPREFLVGMDNVESGLHEGVQYMRAGDKAIFILPSHLAHGLSGDQDKIPPRSSVVYRIELLEIK